MTTHSVLTEALTSEVTADTGLAVRSIAELVAATLCGLHRVNGNFVHMNAVLGDDGYIDIEVTRVYFDGENVTVRVLLHPTAPVPVKPQSAITTGPDRGV